MILAKIRVMCILYQGFDNVLYLTYKKVVGQDIFIKLLFNDDSCKNQVGIIGKTMTQNTTKNDNGSNVTQNTTH